jgi:hypothetical protein
VTDHGTGGLEKILRLLRALSQILAAYALTAEDAKIWLHLRDQFGLGMLNENPIRLPVLPFLPISKFIYLSFEGSSNLTRNLSRPAILPRLQIPRLLL